MKQELDKTMEQVRAPSWALARWRDSGAFGTLVPALAAVPDVVLRAVDALPLPGPATRPLRRSLRFAALFSEVEAGRLRGVLRDLKFSNSESQTVHTLVALWQSLRGELTETWQQDQPPSSRTLRQWAARVGRLRLAGFARLVSAHWQAEALISAAPGDAARASARAVGLYRALLQIAFRDPLDAADLALDGDDLRRLGVPPGPTLGRVLQGLVAFVLEDPSHNTPERLADQARRLLAESGG